MWSASMGEIGKDMSKMEFKYVITLSRSPGKMLFTSCSSFMQYLTTIHLSVGG